MSQSNKERNRALVAAAIVVVAGGIILAVTRSGAEKKAPPVVAKADRGDKSPLGDGQCTPTHCAGEACDACTAQNCNPSTDGCDQMADEAGRKLCEDTYRCFVDPANACLRKGNQGDAIPCWCGTNMTTCWNSNDPPKQANGPCVKQVFAAAASTDAATIRSRLVNPGYPLGRAINLSTCRGTFCIKECGFP